MICEPNFNLPQLIDLESMKKSRKTLKDLEGKFVDNTNVKPKVSYEKREFNMLPLFQDEFGHLNGILSLDSNDYLNCRWNSFLDNIPENYVRVRLYMDYKKSLEARVIRRRLLNGQFYGINNKLAPIPQFNDSRSLTIKNPTSK